MRSFCAHHLLYTEAVELAGSIQIDPTMSMILNRQIRRANAPGAAPEQYYMINLTRVFLDHGIQQLDIRFQAQVHICSKGLSIIPSILLGHPQDWKNNVREFCESYNQEIPNIAGLEAELIVWERLWNEKKAKEEVS